MKRRSADEAEDGPIPLEKEIDQCPGSGDALLLP